jgi:hypothetical protein
VDDMFVRVPIHHQSSNGVHATTTTTTTDVFRNLIRLPSLEELPLLVARKSLSSSLLPDEDENENENENNEGDYENLVREDENEDEEEEDYSILGEEEESNAFGFLSTCHVFNLAILHHLRGFELFCTNDVEVDEGEDEDEHELVEEVEGRGEEEGATATMTTSMIRRHLDRAGCLYELTMRLGRTRSKNMRELEQQEEDQYRHNQTESQPDNIDDNNELGNNNINNSNENSHHVGQS